MMNIMDVPVENMPVVRDALTYVGPEVQCSPVDTVDPEVRQTRSTGRVKDIEKYSPQKSRSVSNRETLSTVSSPCSSSTLTSCVIKQVKEEAWVQCEKPDCLKWRRISKDIADRLGESEPWFCSMNQDPLRNKCNSQEEDYKAAEKLLKKCKLKYRFSALEDGTLVWAKMPGYSKWPAVISPDPSDGGSRILDEDDEPLSYHVEFLGMKHSHAWVHTRFIELYGRLNDQQPLSSQKKGPKNKSSLLYSVGHPYKGTSLRSAIEEADEWLNKPLNQRVEGLSFRYDLVRRLEKERFFVKNQHTRRLITPPLRYAPYKTHSDSLIVVGPPVKNLKKVYPFGCNNKTVTQRNVLKMRHVSVVPRKLRIAPNMKRCDKDVKLSNHVEKRKTKQMCPIPTSMKPSTTVLLSSPIGRASTILSSPKFCPRGESLQERLGFHNSLLNRTKEEKFTMDVEMFVKNQEAFDHDIRKFLKKNGCMLRRIPIWHDVPVTLYQMFLAVYDRGGYQMACSKKQWSSIYRELAGGLSSGGTPAKIFYQRYLLPYEMYLKNQEYKHLFKSKEVAKSEDKNVSDASPDGCDEDVDDGFSSCSDLDELHTMLDEMENLTKCIPDEYTKTVAEDTKDSKGLKIAFYDDSFRGISQEVAMVDLEEFKEACESSDIDRDTNKQQHLNEKVDLNAVIELVESEDELDVDLNNNRTTSTPVVQTGSDMFSVSSGSTGHVLEELVALRDEIDKFGPHCDKLGDCVGKSDMQNLASDCEPVDIMDIDRILQRLTEDTAEHEPAEAIDGLQIVPEVLHVLGSSQDNIGKMSNSNVHLQTLSSHLPSIPQKVDDLVISGIDKPTESWHAWKLPKHDNSVSDLSGGILNDNVLEDLVELQHEFDHMEVPPTWELDPLK